MLLHFTDITKLLIDNGADRNEKHPNTGSTPLFITVEKNNMEGATILLEYNLSPFKSRAADVKAQPLLPTVLKNKSPQMLQL